MSSSSPPETSVVAWPDPARKAAFDAWLAAIGPRHGLRPETLAPASADASFRRYLRLQADGGSRVVMDAPPPQEDVQPFIDIAARLQAAGLHVPQVLEADAEQGFLLLPDLGRTLFLDVLKEAPSDQADRLMRQATDALVRLQRHAATDGLPAYDAALLSRELALFGEWCVQREHGVQWTAAQQAVWQRVSALLIDSALAQPQVFVHRDYMPRNLMVAEPSPAVLDFQDAVRGPITYDVASLLRDAFWSWDEEREIDWAVRYWQAARASALPVGDDFGEFWRALEWMGLQRHLKVLGIFCRLKHRDGKPKYAEDLPRFFAYAIKVAGRYAGLRPLVPLLEPLAGITLPTGLSMR